MRINFIMKDGIKVLLFFIIILIIPVISGCDPTFVDIYTQLNEDYSGTRTVDIAVKTEYIRKGEVTLEKNQSLFNKMLEILPEGEIETFEEEGYTHFSSETAFDDINFLKHISIDDFSEDPSPRFLAKMEIDDYFFYRDVFFEDYLDMKIDETLISEDSNSDYSRMNGLANADSEILNITYQVNFPVNIINSNADLIGDDNIAIWNIKYGEEKNIIIEGRKRKYLSYFLIFLLGIIGLFIIFIIFALIFSSRARKRPSRNRSDRAYDNYFKRDKYFKDDESDEL
jgi:flagellar biosynthesis/type III secretory pathway chaperone